MGYYNPLFRYGHQKAIKRSLEVGIQGFIVVDLPFDEGEPFVEECIRNNLSFIPLITLTSSQTRISNAIKFNPSFIYVVSRLGVTGQQESVNIELDALIDNIRKEAKTCKMFIPLAVGFGVSTNQHFKQISKISEGVVIGSKIIQIIKESVDTVDATNNLKKFCAGVCQDVKANEEYLHHSITDVVENVIPSHTRNNKFGNFGGRFAPEALIQCLDDLESAFVEAIEDPEFEKQIQSFYPFVSRPSHLQKAQRLTDYCKGATIWLKREDLNHTGSHKINNALAQILLARRIGKTRIIAETGAGQHGVATATVCAHFGMKCIVYMGEEDMKRQALNVFRIKLLGGDVVPVKSGSKTLKDAVNEAIRDWVTNVNDTHYVIGSAIGPHPFPLLVRHFQSVIGRETKDQMQSLIGRLPDSVFACVGGGSNAIGMFFPFINDKTELYGIEAGGEGTSSKKHSATLSKGVPGILHGTHTYVLQDDQGQITETHSISAGLDYPGVGPEHSWLKDTLRANYIAVNDEHALLGFRLLCQLEGIIPALETSHAIYSAMQFAKSKNSDHHLVICVSGRGDKDVNTVAEALPKLGPKIGWDLRFQEFDK